MKIMYYCWDEITEFDILDAFNRKGYTVEVDKTPITDKLNDINFAEAFLAKLENNNFDCIFSFNFYPIISKVANAIGIKYISWCYDSPCMTLYTEAVFNSCNYIFVFDNASVLRLKSMGVENVFHMPLAVNTHKLNLLLKSDIKNTDYQHDVSFVGTTYDDHTNFFNDIKNMPEYYKGYFDCLIKAQMDIFGFDFAGNLFTESFMEKLDFVNFNISDEIFLNKSDMFTQLFQKKVTSVERIDILKSLSEAGYSISHFAPKQASILDKVQYMGYVDYDQEMPKVFRNSKINLNISLRSILSGIPLRCLDVMGAGGFLLSNYQPELAAYFEDGAEMVMYTSREDLFNKVEYYLHNEDERIDIAIRGQKKIQQEFSYDIALDKIWNLAFHN